MELTINVSSIYNENCIIHHVLFLLSSLGCHVLSICMMCMMCMKSVFVEIFAFMLSELKLHVVVVVDSWSCICRRNHDIDDYVKNVLLYIRFFFFLVRDQLGFFCVNSGFSVISKMLLFDRVFCADVYIKSKKKNHAHAVITSF